MRVQRLLPAMAMPSIYWIFPGSPKLFSTSRDRLQAPEKMKFLIYMFCFFFSPDSSDSNADWPMSQPDGLHWSSPRGIFTVITTKPGASLNTSHCHTKRVQFFSSDEHVRPFEFASFCQSHSFKCLDFRQDSLRCLCSFWLVVCY